ncbi:MAG: ABC transporter substrate-binding protein [Desulfobacterales bacterium]
MLLLWAVAAYAGGQTLTLGVGRDFYNGPEGQVYLHGSTNTWEGLTRLDETFTLRPWLAESWDSPDGGWTWRFRLREGVRFHDGTPLTAEAAARSLGRLIRHPRYDANHFFKDLESLDAPEPRVLRYRLKHRIPFFPNLVSYYGSPIVHPGTVTEDGRMENLVGTGPFRLLRVRPGEHIVLEAFDRYWQGRPAFASVVFRTILDADSRRMALEAGQIDAVVDFGGILPSQLPALGRLPGITVKRRELGNTHQLIFNCRRSPFAAREMRRWLASRIDRQALVAAVTENTGVVAADPHTRLAPFWAFGCIRPESPLPLPPSAAEGKRELVILLHQGFAGRLPYLEIAQVVQQILREAGLAARIQVQEPGAYRRARLQGEFDLVIGPTGFLTGDPDHHYRNFVSSRAPFSPGWHDEEVEGWIEEAASEVDPQRRRNLYRRLCERVNDERPMFPLYHEVAFYAHGPRVRDLEMDAVFRPDLFRCRPAEEPRP